MFFVFEVVVLGVFFVLVIIVLFGSWIVLFVFVFIVLVCFMLFGFWMMLVGEVGKCVVNDGNFLKVFGEIDCNGVLKKGLLIVFSMMILLMLVLMFFSLEIVYVFDLFN